MKSLTPRQNEVFRFLHAFIEDHRYPPTIRELANHFEISPRGAYDHLKALEKKRWIRCDLKRSRAIEILLDEFGEPLLCEKTEFRQIPILGQVVAGRPSSAIENPDGYLNFHPNDLKPGDYFALKVRGDSMEGVGILDGDMAIISRQNTASNNDIVVALLNRDEVTLKRFYREANRIRLKPENPKYSSIYSQDVLILGKLAKIIRQYE